MRQEGEVVLIYDQDEPAAFARIESIEPDIKTGWYQLTLLLLTIPPKAVTWILREEYIDGEMFSMGGNSMRIEEVERVSPPEDEELEKEAREKDHEEKRKPGKVIPFKRS